ncbi:Ankyrin repeat, partial [Globisporangium splendens]
MTSKASLLDIAYGAGDHRRHAVKKKASKYLVPNNLATSVRSLSIAPVSASSRAFYQDEEENTAERQAKARKRPTVKRNAKSVLWMITNGDVEVDHETVNGETAILAAVASKQVEAVALLIKNGASIDSANEKGYTPLMKAIAAVSLFAEMSALPVSAPKLRKQAPRERASGNNHENANVSELHSPQFDNEIVKAVLAFNPDLMKRDALGKTAFDWARCTGSVHALALLESHQQANSLHHAASSTREQRIAVCRAPLQRHEEYVASTEAFLAKHSLDENKFVQFLNASRSRMPREEFLTCIDDMEMAYTLSASEDPVFFIDHETRQGWTPLTKCASNGYVEAVQVLLEMAVVLYLLRVGANVDQKTREGKTALIHAVSNAQAKIVHHLLRERSLPAKAKDAFDSQLTLLNRQKSMKSAWKRTTAEDAPTENKLEWHETFCNLIHWRDQSGKSALDYTTFMTQVAAGSDASSEAAAAAVLGHLQAALRNAQNHLQYVEANEARTLAISCSLPGCHYVGPRDAMAVHEKHQCMKRTIHCDYCSEPVVFEMQQEREKNDYVQCKVPCVNLQFDCHDRVLFSDLTNHAIHHCQKCLVECRLLCGQVLRFDELFTHETTQCSLHTIECTWGCPATFMAKESGNHRRKHCPKRLMPCVGDRSSSTRANHRHSGSSTASTSGCGMQVVTEEMQFHLTHLCENRKVAYKWVIHGCEDAIGGSAESRHHHEERACPFRLVPCRNECELSGELLACFLPAHYEWQCLLEKKPCPNKCPAPPVAVDDRNDMNSDVLQLPARLLDVHVRKTLVIVQSDWRVALWTCVGSTLCATTSYAADTDFDATSVSGFKGEALEICAQNSATKQLLVDWLASIHQKLTRELDALESETKAHSLKCRVLTGHSERISLQSREYDVVVQSQQQISEHEPAAMDANLRATAFQCPLIEADNLKAHMETKCHLRLLPCPLACGQRLPVHGVATHIAKRCNLRNVECRLGCGALMPFISLMEHEEQTCELHAVFCEHCHESIPWRSMAKHLEKTCTMLLRRCRLGCGLEVSWSESAVHEVSECPKRLVQCTQCENRSGLASATSTSSTSVRCATHNKNALVWALKCQDDDLVTYLLQQVTPVTTALQDEFSNGFSPLTMAVNVGDMEIVKLLLRFGADASLETSRGRTSLAEACLAQNPELVTLLIEHRANVSHTNHQGQNLIAMVRTLAATAAPDDALAQEKWTKIITLLEEQETMERDQHELFLAIATSNHDYVASFLKCSATSSRNPRCVAQAKTELAEAIRVLNESVADAEAKTVNVAHLSEQFDDCASQIQRVDHHYDASAADSNVLEAEMLKLIREITAQNIAQLLNIHVPSDKYLVVMKAICMTSGVLPRGRRNAAEYTAMEWWKTAQALLMDRTLLQRLRGYRKQVVTPNVMAKVRRECMRTPAFAAASAFSSGGDSDDAASVAPEERKSSALPAVDELRGDIVSLLAAWIKGVEMEYKARSKRQTLGVDANLPPRKHGKMALMVAAGNGNVDFVRFLLQQPEVNVWNQGKQGKTAFVHAQEHRFDDVMHLLGAAMAEHRGHFYSSVSALYGICKWGCGFMANSTDNAVQHSEVIQHTHPLAHHEAHTCPKRHAVCPNQCGRADLWAESLHEHVAEECIMRIVTCKQPKCGATFSFADLPTHDRDECELRMTHCECGELMPHQEHVVHAQTRSPMRLVPCPLDCGGGDDAKLRFMDLKMHQRNECPKRRVHCRSGCSANELLLKQHGYHEDHLCSLRRVRSTPRKRRVLEAAARVSKQVWRDECGVPGYGSPRGRDMRSQRISLCGLCGQTNIPYAELATHRSETCKMRQVMCKCNCFAKLPLAHEKERHETSECALRTVWCPLGCRDVLIANTVKKHERVCVMRFVVCSLGCGTELRKKDRVEHETLHCPSMSTIKRRL